MALDIFDLLAELELHIVELYNKARKLTRFKVFSETFQLMETVSANHSAEIKNLGDTKSMPTFDRAAVIRMHDKMKNKLWEDIIKETDENLILKKMAKSEEDTGKLYTAISFYFKKLAEYYNYVASDIEKIAGQEFEHRDALMKLLKHWEITINFTNHYQVINNLILFIFILDGKYFDQIYSY